MINIIMVLHKMQWWDRLWSTITSSFLIEPDCNTTGMRQDIIANVFCRTGHPAFLSTRNRGLASYMRALEKGQMMDMKASLLFCYCVEHIGSHPAPPQSSLENESCYTGCLTSCNINPLRSRFCSHFDSIVWSGYASIILI